MTAKKCKVCGEPIVMDWKRYRYTKPVPFRHRKPERFYGHRAKAIR